MYSPCVDTFDSYFGDLATNTTSIIEEITEPQEFKETTVFVKDSPLTYEEGSIFKQLAEAAIKYRTQEISDEVMAFEPNEEDKFETISNGSYVRRVYYKQHLREREKQGVDEFRQWVKANNKPVP